MGLVFALASVAIVLLARRCVILRDERDEARDMAEAMEIRAAAAEVAMLAKTERFSAAEIRAAYREAVGA